MDGDPFKPDRAKAIIRQILNDGITNSTGHFKKEAIKDSLTIGDAMNVLKGGIVEQPEWENGEWRYRVRTSKIVVVVSLQSESELTIITIWKLKS